MNGPTPLEEAMATATGVILAHPDQASKILSTVRIEDFAGQYRPILEAVHGLRVAGAEVTPLSVGDEMSRRGTLARIGGMAELMRVHGFGFGSAEYACQIIATSARLARLDRIGQRVIADAASSDPDPLRIAQATIEHAQAIIDGIESEGDITTLSVGEFLDQDDPPYDWVIPGLLERGDRLVLTGSEGLGKSVLQRQLAVCAASGVHPFTHQAIPPMRVLYVDCENGPVKLRRALRELVTAGKRHGSDPSDRMFIEPVPAGLDLTRPEDEMWIVRAVSALQPDLLLTGPLYRLHAKNPNDEEPARAVAKVLDRCRAASNCALVTEAHAGHGFGGEKRPVRPTGTSLWLRWPEFGYGLRATDNYDPTDRIVDFVPWRGDREARAWPKQLRSGGIWPWSEHIPSPITPFGVPA